MRFKYTNETNISIRKSVLCELPLCDQPYPFLIWVVSVWNSGILCDEAVYVISWYEISRSRL